MFSWLPMMKRVRQREMERGSLDHIDGTNEFIEWCETYLVEEEPLIGVYQEHLLQMKLAKCPVLVLDADQSVEELYRMGDLIDRGPDSKAVLDYAMKLDQSEKFIFLKGNHEFELLLHIYSGMNEHWYNKMGKETLEKLGEDYRHYIEWINKRPIFYEDDEMIITHAGITASDIDFWDEDHEDGVLWNRGKLRNMGKLQIHGHTPTDSGTYEYDIQSHSVNIDTGMAYGNKLTGIIIEDGKISYIIEVLWRTATKD